MRSNLAVFVKWVIGWAEKRTVLSLLSEAQVPQDTERNEPWSGSVIADLRSGQSRFKTRSRCFPRPVGLWLNSAGWQQMSSFPKCCHITLSGSSCVFSLLTFSCFCCTSTVWIRRGEVHSGQQRPSFIHSFPRELTCGGRTVRSGWKKCDFTDVDGFTAEPLSSF